MYHVPVHGISFDCPYSLMPICNPISDIIVASAVFRQTYSIYSSRKHGYLGR
jgi:hypothetical protein